MAGVRHSICGLPLPRRHISNGYPMAKDKKAALKPQLPQRQTCSKCNAEFSWEPSDPLVKGSPLVARLAKPSDECDCGYGSVAPSLEM